MFVVCLLGVWQRNFEPVVCACVCVQYDGMEQPVVPYTHKPLVQKLRCQTPTKHTTNFYETLRIISVKYSFIVPDDGSHTIRNMSEWSLILILCFLKFLYKVNFNF